MSKIVEFLGKVSGSPAMFKKFKGPLTPGQRIVPTRTRKNDELYQLRIDAGEFVQATQRQNIVLQVNSQAKNTLLKQWVKKNTTHGKLATASFNPNATDFDKEVQGALEVLGDRAQENLRK